MTMKSKKSPSEVARTTVGGLSLPSHVMLVGETGRFYTVLTVLEDASNISPENVLVRQTPSQRTSNKPPVSKPQSSYASSSRDEDEFFCGKCKTTFYKLVEFMAHKQNPASCRFSQQGNVVNTGEQGTNLFGQTTPTILLNKDELITTTFQHPQILSEPQIQAALPQNKFQKPFNPASIFKNPQTQNFNVITPAFSTSCSQLNVAAVDAITARPYTEIPILLSDNSVGDQEDELERGKELECMQDGLNSFLPLAKSASQQSINHQLIASTAAQLTSSTNQLITSTTGRMASSTNQPASLSADDMITSSPKQLITSKQLIEPTEKQMISSTGGQLITSSTNQLINSSRNIHKPSLTDHLNKMRQTSKKIETKALSTSLVTQDKLLGMNTNAQMQVEESEEGERDKPMQNLEKKVFCTYCNKGFKKSFDLSQHIRCHTGEKPFQCLVCGRGFAQKSNVKKHMVTHKVWPKGTSNNLGNNQDCTGVTKSNNPESLLSSTYANKTQQPSISTSGSTTTNTGTDSSAVSVAIASTNSAGNTSRNPAKEHQSERLAAATVAKFHDCPYCHLKFSKHTEYKIHLKDHHDEKCYRCIVEGCGKMYNNVEEFVDHATSHDNITYSCHVCLDRFSDLNDLNLHQYTHLTDHDTREKQTFACSICKNKYSSRNALEYHLETDSHSYPCTICAKEFTAKRLLKKHMLASHVEGANTFDCDVCSKSFKYDYHLKTHKLIHTGDLPFSCSECGAKFNRKDKLKRHSLSHNAKKKFKCPFKEHMNCEREFHRFDKLKLHIMTHGNIKPFKCDVCDLGFSRKENLKSHIAKNHKQSMQLDS